MFFILVCICALVWIYIYKYTLWERERNINNDMNKDWLKGGVLFSLSKFTQIKCLSIYRYIYIYMIVYSCVDIKSTSFIGMLWFGCLVDDCNSVF